MTTAVQLAQSVAPGVSLGFKNRILNGAMTIDQRNAGASVSGDGAYPVDRWKASTAGGGAFSMQQSSTAPAGFINSVVCTVTTADSSIASTDEYSYRQLVEGLNMADFGWGTINAQTVTLSFWVRSSIAGTYAVGFRNSASNRSYPATYTISSANTWEYKSVTVPGDTTGTWLTTNGVGTGVIFSLGAGSSLQGTANSWNAANVWSTSTATQWIATLGATFYITGVQLEVGTAATNFEFRDYGRELIMCQRYYEKRTWGSGYAVCMLMANTANRTQTLGVFDQLVQKRAIPTTSCSSAGTFRAGWLGGAITATSILGTEASLTTANILLGLGSDPGTTGLYALVEGSSTAYFELNSEL